MMQTYFSPAQLKRINDDPALLSLLYDLDLMPEQVTAAILHARGLERERCAKIAEEISEKRRDLHDKAWAGDERWRAALKVGVVHCGQEIATKIREG